MKSYTNVVRAIVNTPWAILPETMATIRAIVGEAIERGVTGEQLSREQIDARIGNGPGEGGNLYTIGSVAVLRLSGAIIPRATLFSDLSGGTSVEGFRNRFLEAMDDDDVSAILLDVNSPGGMIDLVPELATLIRSKRGVKPMAAVANTLMASAAYWIASQADEVYVTESGDAGSIGVITMHDDFSGALEQAGITTTLITAGKFKGEANPYQPLSDGDRAALQRRIDEAYDLFVRDVAAGRGVSEASVRDGMGQGRLLKAKAALGAGLVDGIQDFETTVRSLASPTRRQRGTARADVAAPAPEPEPAEGASEAPLVGSEVSGEAAAALERAAAIVGRMTELAEFRRGRPSAAKVSSLETLRAQAVALAGAIDEALDAATPSPSAAPAANGPEGEGDRAAALLDAELAFAGHASRLRMAST